MPVRIDRRREFSATESGAERRTVLTRARNRGSRNEETPRTVRRWGVSKGWSAIPTLPQRCRCSTIGASKLNFRVRNGIGWTFEPLSPTVNGLGTRNGSHIGVGFDAVSTYRIH
jgi:hypothetical protein